MTSGMTKSGDSVAVGGDTETAACISFPASPLVRDLMRLRRKRAAERPAIEAFERQRLEALRRILAACEDEKRAG